MYIYLLSNLLIEIQCGIVLLCKAKDSKLHSLTKWSTRKEWIHNCGVSDENSLQISNVFVFENHFKPEDFYITKVKPTQYLRVQNPITN